MSQTQNSTAPAGAQQALTDGCQYCCIPSTGDFLAVKGGAPVSEAMIEASRLLEGTWMLLRRIEDDEGDLSYLEVGAIRMLIETASALQTSCRRSLAAAPGGDQ